MNPRIQLAIVGSVLAAVVLLYMRYEGQRGNTRWNAQHEPSKLTPVQPPQQPPGFGTEPINASGPMLQVIERLDLDVHDLKKGFSAEKLARLVKDVQAMQHLAEATPHTATNTAAAAGTAGTTSG